MDFLIGEYWYKMMLMVVSVLSKLPIVILKGEYWWEMVLVSGLSTSSPCGVNIDSVEINDDERMQNVLKVNIGE